MVFNFYIKFFSRILIFFFFSPAFLVLAILSLFIEDLRYWLIDFLTGAVE